MDDYPDGTLTVDSVGIFFAEAYTLNVCRGVQIDVAFEAGVDPDGGSACIVRDSKTYEYDAVPTPPPTPTRAPAASTPAPTRSPTPEGYGLQPDCDVFVDTKFNICLDISSESRQLEPWFPLVVSAKERWERIISADP